MVKVNLYLSESLSSWDRLEEICSTCFSNKDSVRLCESCTVAHMAERMYQAVSDQMLPHTELVTQKCAPAIQPKLEEAKKNGP